MRVATMRRSDYMTEMAARGRRRKTPKPPIELQLSLGEWGPKGAVEAEHEGRRMAIDRGIPGEDVIAEVDRRRRPWRGVVQEALQPSEDRIEAPCPYYAAGCGGCQWQHMSYERQLSSKAWSVDRAMEVCGVGARTGQIHGMETPWRYRHTAAVAIGWEAGFRPRGRKGIVEIR